MSIEDQFLSRLAEGREISQDEYEQMREDFPPELIASALVRRFRYTEEVRTLIEAAQIYSHAGFDYEAMEVCSRFPRVTAMQKIVQHTLPRLRQEYPGIHFIGKLLDEAFLVIDLNTGKMTRFPPIFPATVLKQQP